MAKAGVRGVVDDALSTDKQYDDGGTTRSYKEMDPEKVVVFWSDFLSLKVILYKTYDVLGVPKKEMYPVQFMTRKYETDDQDVIDNLRRHRSFGGSFAKKFTDHALNGGQPMFWEGALPVEVLNKIQERESTFTTEEFSYEPSKAASQRYSDSD